MATGGGHLQIGSRLKCILHFCRTVKGWLTLLKRWKAKQKKGGGRAVRLWKTQKLWEENVNQYTEPLGQHSISLGHGP